MVSLVRIKGTDCKALELGQVADKTGGEVCWLPLPLLPSLSSPPFLLLLPLPLLCRQIRLQTGQERSEIATSGREHTSEAEDDSLLQVLGAESARFDCLSICAAAPDQLQ